MLPFALLIAMQTSSEPKQWFGPQTATFPFAFAGNPYDFEKNDVRVQFIDGKGKRVERLAYFDAEEMAWKSVLVAEAPGKYKPVMFRNGVEVDAVPEPDLVELDAKPIPKGFIRVDPDGQTRFRYDYGAPYFPLGFNLGWQSQNVPEMTEMLATMGNSGVNWTRIWACQWDGKNPWIGKGGESDGDRMLPAAFDRWDTLVSAAEQSGVAFQFVLFHHGLFSTRTDSNWASHPWNKSKGGFLEKPADFFTDPEAKRRTKMWLRYAAARWGHSRSVMAWELFNEVEWVDARYENRWEDVLSWHKEMADFLRTTDSYRHLIATSSTFEMPNLYQAVDFYQPHIYPPDVRTAISDYKMPNDKPGFFGEFGPGNLNRPDQRLAVRDGIWAGILSGHAGAGSFWTWEAVHNQKLYDEYRVANRVLNETGFRDKRDLRPARVSVVTAGTADLTLNPGAGWAKAEKTTFLIAPGTKPEGLGQLSTYLQGPGKRDMFPEPLTFKFNAAKPGVFTFQLSEVSKLGARIQFRLNGRQVAEKTYPATAENTRTDERLTVPYQAGQNEIQIENVGADWVNMRAFTFTGMDAEVSAQAIRGPEWMMVRLTANPGAEPKEANLSALALPAGDYRLTTYNLDTGEPFNQSVRVSGLDHRQKIPMASKDILVVYAKD
jgi:hypothetical protein